MTSISTQRWMAGDFGHRVPMTVAALRDEHFGAVRGGLPVVPSSANLRFSSRPSSAQVAFHPMTRSFAGHATIPQRTPFETQRQTLARSFHTEAPVERFGATSSARFGGSTFNANTDRVGPARGSDFAPRSGSDQWSHFNGNRGTTYGGRYGGGSNEAGPSYSRPATGNSFARPQGEDRPSYARPSSENFSRPSQSFSRGNQDFSRPSGPSYSRPANENYSRPSQSYSRPSYSGGGYARPQAEPRQAPARSYARPSGSGERAAQRPAPAANDRERGDRNAR